MKFKKKKKKKKKKNYNDAGIFLFNVFICFNYSFYRSNENEANVAKMNGDGVRNISKNTTITLNNSNFHLAIYSGLLAGILVFGLLRAFLFFQVTVKAGETLHNTMFNSLIRARISFFDTNPVGKVS